MGGPKCSSEIQCIYYLHVCYVCTCFFLLAKALSGKFKGHSSCRGSVCQVEGSVHASQDGGATAQEEGGGRSRYQEKTAHYGGNLEQRTGEHVHVHVVCMYMYIACVGLMNCAHGDINFYTHIMIM